MAKKTKIVDDQEHILSGKNTKPKFANPRVKNTELKVQKEYNWDLTSSFYSDELLPKLETLCSKGLTNRELAIGLGITDKTFHVWCRKYPQFAFALAKYRGVADIFVENCLYQSAIGYHYTEQQVTNKGEIVVLQKYMPGSVFAQKFYLVNRMKERYKNKVEAEITVLNDISNMNVNIRRRGDD